MEIVCNELFTFLYKNNSKFANFVFVNKYVPKSKADLLNIINEFEEETGMDVLDECVEYAAQKYPEQAYLLCKHIVYDYLGC